MFGAALALAPADRDAFLVAQSLDDPDVRNEVKALLDADTRSQSDAFIERVIDRAVMDLPEASSFAVRQVGAYRLLAELGHGGMGTVYLAERADASYDAQVAIKFVRGAFASPDVERRFRAERQILADLTHPNIARLLDGGSTTDGTPYYVMELVDGIPIDVYCDSRALETRARLMLFRTVCVAVQYAHQSLVIHRDLKPANILVTAEGIPKLLDFGIAAMLDPTSGASPDTQSVARVLTPTYASPEQIRGGHMTVATDVYSLGAVLHKLLVGRVPVDVPAGASLAEIERLVCDEEATPTREARQLLGSELHAIVLKALSKAPTDRYASVAELAEDLRRYLDGEPVRAARDSTLYRVAKFARRHARSLGVTAALLTTLVAIVSFYTLRVARARDLARLEAARAEQIARFLTQTFEAADPYRSSTDVTVRELVARGQSRIEAELANQPGLQATMFGAIGRVYQGLGLYPDATSLLERALALQHKIGAGDLEIARAEFDLGVLARVKGDYPTADSLARASLERRRMALAADDPDVVRSQVAVAQVAAARAQYEQAERLLRAAAQSAAHFSGEDRKELPQVLADLGEVRARRGDYGEADSILRSALRMRLEMFGDSHPTIAEAVNRLGNLRLAQGDLSTADSLLRDAVATGRRVLGDDHPAVASYLHDLALLLNARARFSEADSLMQDALEHHRERLGDAHPQVARDMLRIAYVHQNRGDLVTAERLAREALQRLQRHYGTQHPEVVSALNVMAGVVGDRGDYDASERYTRQAIAAARSLFGDAHERVISLLAGHGTDLLWSERYEESERVLQEAYVSGRRTLSFEHPTTDRISVQLGALYVATGRTTEALPFVDRSLKYRRRVYGEMNPETADAMLALSAIQAEAGRGEEAARLARETQRIYEKSGLGQHWVATLSRTTLGQALRVMGRYSEAETELLAAYHRQQRQWPNGHSYLTYTRKQLVALYVAWKRPERAARFREEVTLAGRARRDP